MTVQETKKQHYLPFAYLKYFRCNEAICERSKATIYRDDGNSVTEEKVSNQCYANNFYRETNTTESELGLSTFEKDWDECIKRARSEEDESALLMLQMIMYHFRNISIRLIQTNLDRFTLVSSAAVNYVEQKILRLPSEVRINDDPSHVMNFPWEVKIVNFEEPILLTSDNPSVMTIRSTAQELYGPFFLPISPTELLVAIDRSIYKFSRTAGIDKDAFFANAAVASQSSRHVFTSFRQQESVRESLWEFMKDHRIQENERGYFHKNVFTPAHPIYDYPFSFIERKSSAKLSNAIRQASRS